ncbi:MAG TPA: M48 family metalloprotease [Candidatus Aquilonibacter sp.]|nr:M48 family metalloprotease [Candidatus Aquilonibacter sp.]
MAFAALGVLLLGASPRPNALDAAVNAIPVSALLSRPASALVDLARASAADRLVHLMLPGWFVAFALQIVVLAYFWQSGMAARLRDRLRRRFESEFIVRFAFGAALGLIGRLASLLPELYIYRLERSMSLSDQLLRGWAIDWMANTVVTMLLAGIVVTIVLRLVDRTQLWYAYTIGCIIAGSIVLAFLQPLVVLPRFGHYEPLPEPYAADAQRLEAAAHLSVPILVHVNDRSHLESSVVTGLGPTQRIILTDAVLQASTRAEVRFVVARQLGYVASGAPFRIALFDGLFVVFGIALAIAVADRIGFRRDDDPVARLALVGALLGIMYLIVVPMDNAMLRSMSKQSEHYALGLANDRAAAVRNIIRTADQRLESVCVTGAAQLFTQQVLDPAQAVQMANGIPSGCK